VNAERLGRLARALRVRQQLTQVALANRAGVSRRAVSMLERGQIAALRVQWVQAIAVAIGARFDVRLFWNGPELDRLLDARHAALGASVKRLLERWGWLVRVEVSYSQYGERGRIDLLALHPPTGTLLVIEIKTELVDVQALLGSLDAKTRLARDVARRLVWEARAIVPAIVFAEDRTTRNRLERVVGLFDRYSVRGRAATTWLRKPVGAPSGLLWFTAVADVPSRPSAARVRVRDSKIGSVAAH
jgi:transcriptional regulator with XRE-family HTH domain